jgi:hypothetical protein
MIGAQRKIERQLVIKARSFFLPLAYFVLLNFSTGSTLSAATVTFDDIPNANAPYPYLTNGYEKLNWTNFACLDAVHERTINGLNGAYYGMVSSSNVAFNAFGSPAQINAAGTNFNFFGAYLAGAWRSNLNIEVQGFSGSSLLYDEIVAASATNSTLFTFNYFNIDRLTFNSFGGQYAGFGSDASTFVMDNFTFEFVPEPSSLLLTAGGVLTLWAFVRRRRRSP